MTNEDLATNLLRKLSELRLKALYETVEKLEYERDKLYLEKGVIESSAEPGEDYPDSRLMVILGKINDKWYQIDANEEEISLLEKRLGIGGISDVNY